MRSGTLDPGYRGPRRPRPRRRRGSHCCASGSTRSSRRTGSSARASAFTRVAAARGAHGVARGAPAGRRPAASRRSRTSPSTSGGSRDRRASSPRRQRRGGPTVEHEAIVEAIRLEKLQERHRGQPGRRPLRPRYATPRRRARRGRQLARGRLARAVETWSRTCSRHARRRDAADEHRAAAAPADEAQPPPSPPQRRRRRRPGRARGPPQPGANRRSRRAAVAARRREPRYARAAMIRIDLRSDTVTHPTDAMRRAMAEAELGDDVFGDDPTVNALEARAAELLGKDAGLFVASGTMGNLVSLMAHLPRGHEAIAGASTHTVMDEAGGHAVVVGATIRTLPRARRRDDGPRRDRGRIAGPRRTSTSRSTGLVVLEHTHAHSGGTPLPMDYVRAVAGDRPRPGRPAPHRRRTVVQRDRRARRHARRSGSTRRLGHLLPVEGPVGPDRLGRRWLRRRSSPGRVARASSSAAACARSACLPLPGSSRCRTDPTG